MAFKKAGPGQCTFLQWYVGECSEPVVGDGPFCETHSKTRCRNGRQAIRDGDYGILFCGAVECARKYGCALPSTQDYPAQAEA